MRTFEFQEGKSHKFWNIELKGAAFTVTFGRVGSKGQAQTKEFADVGKATTALNKLVTEKLAKGYVETTGKKPPAASPVQKSLEKTLAADPDDLGAHSAYADALIEAGDPRGEFIQVQLALEDPQRPATERKQLQAREKALLKTHARAWLGDLARYLMDGWAVYDAAADAEGDRPSEGDERAGGYEYQFARGWLDSVRIKQLSVEFAIQLAQAPAARLLRRLVVDGDCYDQSVPPKVRRQYHIPERGFAGLFGLMAAPWLKNLRTFQLGEDQGERYEGFSGYCYARQGLPELIKEMPRLEELYLYAKSYDPTPLFKLKTLSHLRILKVYHLSDYPLEVLAKNAAFANLTHLLLHPHFHEEHALGETGDAPEAYITVDDVKAIVRSPHLKSLTHLRLRVSDMGDKGVAEIVNAGILKRLKMLDLRHGIISDAGAQALADCPDVANLELLDLERNALTRPGKQALRKVLGKRAMVDSQQTAEELSTAQFLCEGDFE